MRPTTKKRHEYIRNAYQQVRKGKEDIPDTRLLKYLEAFGIYLSYSHLNAIKNGYQRAKEDHELQISLWGS